MLHRRRDPGRTIERVSTRPRRTGTWVSAASSGELTGYMRRGRVDPPECIDGSTCTSGRRHRPHRSHAAVMPTAYPAPLPSRRTPERLGDLPARQRVDTNAVPPSSSAGPPCARSLPRPYSSNGEFWSDSSRHFGEPDRALGLLTVGGSLRARGTEQKPRSERWSRTRRSTSPRPAAPCRRDRPVMVPPSACGDYRHDERLLSGRRLRLASRVSSTRLPANRSRLHPSARARRHSTSPGSTRPRTSRCESASSSSRRTVRRRRVSVPSRSPTTAPLGGLLRHRRRYRRR
jgi:hypothetical protein